MLRRGREESKEIDAKKHPVGTNYGIVLTILSCLGGRPYRALSLLPHLTQGLVALTGLRTLGFEGVAPLGLAPPPIPYQERS